jgi:hypothetical protein
MSSAAAHTAPVALTPKELFEIKDPLTCVRKAIKCSESAEDVAKNIVIDFATSLGVPAEGYQKILVKEAKNAKKAAASTIANMMPKMHSIQRLGTSCFDKRKGIAGEVIKDYSLLFTFHLDPNNNRSRVLNMLHSENPDIGFVPLGEVVKWATQNNKWANVSVPAIIWRQGDVWGNKEIEVFHVLAKTWYAVDLDNITKFWNIEGSQLLDPKSAEVHFLGGQGAGHEHLGELITDEDDPFVPRMAHPKTTLRPMSVTMAKQDWVDQTGERSDHKTTFIVSEEMEDSRGLTVYAIPAVRFANEMLPFKKEIADFLRFKFAPNVGETALNVVKYAGQKIN